MAKYTVKLMQRASSDLDDIYNHIADDLKETGTAEKMADSLEEAILSLNEIPYRGSIRRTGAFANRGYRQLFVKNFTIVHRIDEARKMVIIVTVRYTPSSF
ncbi:MAG: type II toxin-antitoxin system RelE/ParE family toxin [Clostridiales bacterium]|nr:type II toxin-antitoxin system RelE/ParE family toxin [Clostridiales bacterium]